MIHTKQEFYDKVLGPIDISEFFGTYWEKKPLHISRSEQNHFSDILTTVQIEEALSSLDLYFPRVQLTQHLKSHAVADYADENNRILPLRLLQGYRSGATIVISQAQSLITTLSNLSRNMQAAFRLRCQTNVYLSPPGNQGFNTHYDTHDVLILQVSGKKTFKIYSRGVDLPFSEDSFDPSLNRVGPMQEELTLTAGDTLYIPRGVLHDAVAHEDSPSLHITLGVFPIIMRDLLQEMIQVVAEKNIDFRRSLPCSVLNQSEQDQDSFERQVRESLEQAFSKANLKEAVSRLHDNVFIQNTQDVTHLLSGYQNPAAINLESVIRVKHDYVLSTEWQGGNLKLRTYGQVLEFAEPISVAVEDLLHRQHCKVCDLVGLDDDQRIALSSRLLQENIVELLP